MTNASVLIIEGKKADRPSFASQLQKKGFAVTVVANGSEALLRLDFIGQAAAVKVDATQLELI